MSSRRDVVQVLFLGPNRWPKTEKDPQNGLKIRESIVHENCDLDAQWLLLENEPADTDLVAKFLSTAQNRATHIFLIWPQNAKMAGTQDELILWQAITRLKGKAPECYLFHETGTITFDFTDEETKVLMNDPQGKSPYLYDILAHGVFLQQWVNIHDLRHQIREVLIATWGLGFERPNRLSRPLGILSPTPSGPISIPPAYRSLGAWPPNPCASPLARVLRGPGFRGGGFWVGSRRQGRSRKMPYDECNTSAQARIRIPKGVRP
jgi:hypothetical protein